MSKKKKKMIAAIVAVIVTAILGLLKATETVTDPIVLDGIGQSLDAVAGEVIDAMDEDTEAPNGGLVITGAGQVPVVKGK
jgi:hypothetical protein